MSQLVFNGHSHVENEVGIKIDSQTIEDTFRRIIGRIEKWTIIGALKPDGDTLATKMTALEAAYKNNAGTSFGDATFTSGSNVHTLSNATSFGGVKVKAFGYMSGPWKMRTELANRRSFYAVLQAEYRYSRDLYAYRETVRQRGNSGPKWIFNTSLVNAPEFQVLNLSTPVVIVQRGIAIGRGSLPTANSPLYPASIHGDVSELDWSAPEIITSNGGTQKELYAIGWTYVFEGITPLASPPAFNLPAIT